MQTCDRRARKYGSEVAVVSRQGAAPSKRALFGATLMLRVPLWAGPSHVMTFGPIEIVGDLDQPVQPRHDHIQTLANRCRRGLRSMRPYVSFICAFAAHGTPRFVVTDTYRRTEFL
jgi:hypothetical protein